MGWQKVEPQGPLTLPSLVYFPHTGQRETQLPIPYLIKKALSEPIIF